jgi:hypothetical protein
MTNQTANDLPLVAKTSGCQAEMQVRTASHDERAVFIGYPWAHEFIVEVVAVVASEYYSTWQALHPGEYPIPDLTCIQPPLCQVWARAARYAAELDRLLLLEQAIHFLLPQASVFWRPELEALDCDLLVQDRSRPQSNGHLPGVKLVLPEHPVRPRSSGQKGAARQAPNPVAQGSA